MFLPFAVLSRLLQTIITNIKQLNGPPMKGYNLYTRLYSYYNYNKRSTSKLLYVWPKLAYATTTQGVRRIQLTCALHSKIFSVSTSMWRRLPFHVPAGRKRDAQQVLQVLVVTAKVLSHRLAYLWSNLIVVSSVTGKHGVQSTSGITQS